MAEKMASFAKQSQDSAAERQWQERKLQITKLSSSRCKTSALCWSVPDRP
jgi:hypothetical protein